jgi:hypothetical protein
MEIFDHAEQQYVDYVKNHPDHYVLNLPRTGSTYSILVHSATCGTVSTPKRTNYTTTELIKIAFPDRDEARKHAQTVAERRGISWKVCQICNAEPKH